MAKNSANETVDSTELKEAYEKLGTQLIFARRLQEARKNLGMTQSEVAKLTNIAQADISRIESGRANPTISTLARFAKGLGMEIDIRLIPQSQVL